MRFRRRQKILPGVYLNFSGSGVSTTIGGRGASINIGRNGTYLNTGIPGTGLYNRQRLDGGGNNSRNQSSNYQQNDAVVNSISSNSVTNLSSNSLDDLKNTFHECYTERAELTKEIKKTKFELLLFQLLYGVSLILIVGFFIKWFKENVSERKSYISDLDDQYEKCVVDIDIDIDQNTENQFISLTNKYRELSTCSKIWDLISSSSQNSRVTRSNADAAVQRQQITFGSNTINIIQSRFKPLYFANANGGDLYFYPGFIFYFESDVRFALIDLRDLDLSFINLQFMEQEAVPTDATIAKHTWAKSNADGSPDRRFKNNYQIPVCQYGRIDLKTTSGLNESYMFSNFEKTRSFANTLHQYLQLSKS